MPRARVVPATPAPDEPVCELCFEPGLLCDLPFKKARTRKVCVMCLAQAIQNLTSWKMVKVVQTYINSTLRGQILKRQWAEIHAQETLALAQEAVNGPDTATG